MASLNIVPRQPVEIAVENTEQTVWQSLVEEGKAVAAREPMLRDILEGRVLNPTCLTESLCVLLSEKLDRPAMRAAQLQGLFAEVYAKHPQLGLIAALDLQATLTRDPAAKNFITPFMFFKGFHALQSWRVARALWEDGRHEIALFLQNRISMVFDVDIHPNAQIGHGIVMDHATGIVIGETAIVGNNILMLHEVTLGTRGFERGDRHPVIGDNVILGAGAKVLGRIHVGSGAKVAAGSLVLEPVAPDTTVAGVPARVVLPKS
jgi:serine O-acetyltransferase